MFVGEKAALAHATQQYGVINREQAREARMTDRQIEYRIAQGRWVQTHPTVYRIAGAPVSARQRAMAACLWLGAEARVSHTSAARLFRMEGIRKASLHVSVPAMERRGAHAARSFTLHRPQCLEACDRAIVDGIPCTSPTRTLIDIAGLVSEETLEIAFESARRMRLTSVDALAARFSVLGRRGRNGVGKIRRLLEHQTVGTRPLESPLEVRFWRLLRKSNIPLPQRQVELIVATGARYRVDFLYPEARLVVECDGFEAHAGHLRWKRDRRRVADIELEGYRVMQFTWDDVVQRPDATLNRLAYAFSVT